MLTLFETGEWRILIRSHTVANRADEYIVHIPCLKEHIKHDFWHTTLALAYLPPLSGPCGYCSVEFSEKDLNALKGFQELYYTR